MDFTKRDTMCKYLWRNIHIALRLREQFLMGSLFKVLNGKSNFTKLQGCRVYTSGAVEPRELHFAFKADTFGVCVVTWILTRGIRMMLMLCVSACVSCCLRLYVSLLSERPAFGARFCLLHLACVQRFHGEQREKRQ